MKLKEKQKNPLSQSSQCTVGRRLREARARCWLTQVHGTASCIRQADVPLEPRRFYFQTNLLHLLYYEVKGHNFTK